MEEQIEQLLRRVSTLEKKVEKYYDMLKIDNELSYILHGTYLTDDDIQKILEGKY